MQPDHPAFLPWIFALLIPLALYRRFRRSFGQQPLGPARRRMVIFGVIGALLVLSSATLRATTVLLSEAAGALAGIALAVWGMSRTRFLARDGQIYYVPHTYTGIAVSVLFVGRLIYRLVQLYAVPTAVQAVPGVSAAQGMGGGAPAAIGRSPLTAGVLFVMIGYYVCYYGLVLRKSRHLTPGDFETPAPPSGPKVEGATRGG
jgi:hypothetical protein